MSGGGAVLSDWRPVEDPKDCDELSPAIVGEATVGEDSCVPFTRLWLLLLVVLTSGWRLNPCRLSSSLAVFQVDCQSWTSARTLACRRADRHWDKIVAGLVT